MASRTRFVKAITLFRVSGSFDLWDYRRRVFDLYRQVREGEPGQTTWQAWREARDQLFREHPQSPIEDRRSFQGLDYFAHDPGWRTVGTFTPIDDEDGLIGTSHQETARFVTTGTVHFEVKGQQASLDVLWLDAYGGGVFLPFRDATNGDLSYGGGRYLLDTVKGADLGHHDDQVVLDFNYAYHPSCAHSPRWACPLAPPSNRLEFGVEAGERLTPGEPGPVPT
jgi:hypothetical protein